MNKPRAKKTVSAVKPSKISEQIKELTIALQHERADSINLRRQHEEQLVGLKKSLKASIVRELLPVIDNLERALKHVPKELNDNDYIKGIEAVVKQFEKVLSDMGVEHIKTVGEEFDPRYHEAVSLEEGEGSREVVCEELQAGYRLGEDVIRHAMVKVRMEN